MKPGARVALGVGIGYFLGRTKKMRVAMMLAGAGMTGKLPSNPQELLQRSASMLGSSPEINKITESVRGELMHAARAAAVTAASNRIDALNERLQSRASGGGRSEEPEDAEYEDEYDESRDEEKSRGSRRRGSRNRDEEPDYDETDEEGADEEDSGEEDSGDEGEAEPERPAPRRRAARATSRPRTSRSKKTADSEDPDDSEEAPPKPRKRAARSTASSSSSGRAPVRRTKR
ncbi:DNA polymerase V family protein [Rhodococcus pyridinivorans]|uniref:DNA polymerase V family protein n=1 Tax=Rhodococcus pyridinivorans TaxID=103816 RepID=UPI002164A411|nr:DNA polymerase V family protein [Rhodococcus pyridinivorans]UVT23448.1 DNA polymerase V family protein [Rhodococcus pyridinivorans]